jgi:uncharacterized membrane protein
MTLINQVITGNIGLVHLIASVTALILGTISLSISKGTSLHKKIGYGYAVSMLILLVTAFMLYNLFGRWGIFHWAALVSSLTLIAGMIPILLRSKNYLSLHLGFMYWSVIGLYGAFAAEVLVRVPSIILEHGRPNSSFYTMTGIGVGVIMAVAAFFFIGLSLKWENQFSINKPTKI